MSQSKIIQLAQSLDGEFTTAQAIEKLENEYYCNGAHHIQAILKRMVDNGLITRIKRGHYRLNQKRATRKKTNTTQVENPAQIELF